MSGAREPAFNQNDVEGDYGMLTRYVPTRHWWGIPRRYVVALMCYIAFTIREWLVLNIAMIVFNRFRLEEEDINIYLPQIANWTIEEIEGIVYSFHWANAVAQLPSAMLAISFSPRRLMAVMMFVGCTLHMLTPWALRNSSTGIIIIMFLQGLFTAILDCSCIGIWKIWCPPSEKTSLILLAFSGKNITGMLIFHLSDNFGPDSIYYFVGTSGIIWVLMWMGFTSESPMSDPLITDNELQYLERVIPSRNKEKVSLRSIPVKSILKSLPVLSLGLVFLTSAFSMRSAILYLFEVQDSGHSIWIFWFTYLYSAVVIPACGFLIDFLINNKIVTATIMRKILCCGGLILYPIFMTGTFVPSTLTLLICFIMSTVFLPFTYAGALPNVVDLSPVYSCVIMGLVMTLSAFSEIAFDFVMPELETEHQENHNWLLSFIPSAVLGVISALVFGIFGSSEEQSWSTRTTSAPVSHGNDAVYYPGTDTAEDDTLVTENL